MNYDEDDDESEDYEYDDELSEQEEEERRPLIGLIIDNDIETFHNLIMSNKKYINDIGEKGKYQGLPIKYAIMYKRTEITELLIDNENFDVHLWIKMSKGILQKLVDYNMFDAEFTFNAISKILDKLNSDEKNIIVNIVIKNI